MEIFIAPNLEKTRRLLEERDVVMMAAIQDHSKLVKIKSHKERLKLEHFIRNAVDHIHRLNLTITSHKEQLREQIAAERSQLDAHADLSVFYGMLKQLKEYHRRFPNEPADVVERLKNVVDGLAVGEEQLERMFSGAESLGKFLDLNECFEVYQNKLHGKDDYLHFISSFHEFQQFDLQTCLSPSYVVYLKDLIDYLESFKRRAMPLIFDSEPVELNNSVLFAGEDVLLAEYERITLTLFDERLYCQACQKLFTNPNSHDSHLQGKTHLKNLEKYDNSNQTPVEVIQDLFTTQKQEKLDKVLQIAQLQYKVKQLKQDLDNYITATALNVERKQAMTAEELAEEEKREKERLRVKESMSEHDRSFMEKDMDGGVYNPLKLPLDWDGKPIPLWLWKLHGLGTKFPCEVCGNYVYLGRKAFDQHFHEWRHTHGMRCLGVPNTRHFYQITKIDDVLRLWDTMKSELQQNGAANAGAVEEVEDRHGNVYTKRVFEDMLRQGLL